MAAILFFLPGMRKSLGTSKLALIKNFRLEKEDKEATYFLEI